MSEAPRVIDESMLDDRVEFERGLSAFPTAAAALIAANAAVFAAQVALGALSDVELIVGAGAKKTTLVLAGQWWRLLTATFLHGSLGHLVGNMIALYILGMGCEHAFGRSATFAAYVACGAAATLVSCLSAEVSLGASGAVFGLLGFLGTSLYRHRARLAVRDRRTGLVLIVWAIYLISTASFDPRIDNLAHAGGLLAGWAFGRRSTPAMLRPERTFEPGWDRWAAAAALALACAGWAVAARWR